MVLLLVEILKVGEIIHLENLIQSMLDLKIKFPIWVLNSNNVWEQDGVVFIDNTVLDDLNQKGDTLGKRRLQTPLKNLFN